jgi:hypothetical protein
MQMLVKLKYSNLNNVNGGNSFTYISILFIYSRIIFLILFKEGAEDEDSCVICGCCLNQGTISAAFRINRRGFVSGESILCDAEIYNGSVSSIKSTKLKLYKVVLFVVIVKDFLISFLNTLYT